MITIVYKVVVFDDLGDGLVQTINRRQYENLKDGLAGKEIKLADYEFEIVGTSYFEDSHFAFGSTKYVVLNTKRKDA